MLKKILIKGAKEHNLKNISLEIPKEKLVVITGLSGSGKSSLAFDTIYAEGQRRYVESLSAYARQFLDKMKKPKVDLIEGLSPAISIEQKNTPKNPRSIVATVTEIYDYMRVLFARVGIPYSPFTGKPIVSQSVSEMVDKVKALPKNCTIFLLAPVVRGRKGEYKKDIINYKKRGFQKIKVDGKYYDINDFPDLNKKIKHDISILVDRIVLNSNLGNRLADSIETALNLSNGLLVAEYENETIPKKFRKKESVTFSSKFSCPESGFTIEEIEPRLFSFNSPFGACEECEGIGRNLNVDPNLVIPDKNKSIADGAIEPWAKSKFLYYAQTLASIAKHYKFSLDLKWKKLPKKIQDIILYGSDEEEIKFYYDDGYEKYDTKKTFEGVINNLERRYLETDSDWKREEISQYQSETNCEKCKGLRLKDEALCVKINKLNISQITQFSIEDSQKWFADLENVLTLKEKKIAQHILKEINERLNFLLNVGLNYITLSRESGTLSSGESQRIRLASQIGSGLTGVLYVLDEPSIGLHQRDNKKLIAALKKLRDLGNTVIVVEHDVETMENADHIIDLGPEGVQKCLDKTGFGFMFAQVFHPSMKFAAGPRKEIGIRTIFNILGPLTNPAAAKSQILGVANKQIGSKIANSLNKLGRNHALVVHGLNGLDEISISDSTMIWELKNKTISEYLITPEDLGLKRAHHKHLKIKSTDESVSKFNEVIDGIDGPARDVVLMNAAAALLVGARVSNLKEGVFVAAESIDNGSAKQTIRKLIEVSNSLD